MWTIAKNGFRECLRYRVVYYIFAMALLFILMGKGCNPGAIKGNDLFFDDQARQNLAVATAFHLIVFWSMMLSGLVSAQVLTRELEDGTALLTLSRPLSRWGFLAGKVLSVMMLTTLNLFVLGAIFFVMFYVDVGHLNWRIFASFSLVTVNMLVYCLMGLVLSLVVPRMLVPLLAIVVYAMSVWAALPFHFEKLRFVWDPSETVTQLYTWLPGFGDLQFLGAACIGALPEPVEIALAVVKLLGYGLLMWVVLVMLFRRQAV